MASSPTILWLVRAGESIWQREHRLQGRADLPLSAEGRAAILAELAQFGPGPTSPSAPGHELAAVHHPPDEGATETAAIVARAAGSRTKALRELADPDLGLLDGLTLDVFEERFPTRHRQWQEEPLSLVPPEGEPLIDARRRVLDELARLAKKHRGKEFAVVLHPLALGFARCALADRSGRDLWKSLEGRPRLERYLLPDGTEQRLLEA